MITFACKNIEFDDLLRCSFQLNKTELNLFKFLFELGEEDLLEITEISKKLKLDRSTIQKAIKNLIARNLVFRKQINLDTGGYRFYYRIKNKIEIKHRMHEIIESWYKLVKTNIESW